MKTEQLKTKIMEFTLQELQTIKDCLDITLSQLLEEKSNLREKIIKLLDKIDEIDE